MPYNYLNDKEKRRWLHHLETMEAFHLKKEDQINEASSWIDLSKKRLLLLKEYYFFQSNFYAQIKQDLIKNFGFRISKRIDEEFTMPTQMPSKYLRRDWGVNQSSNECEMIVNHIKIKLKDLGIKPQKKALFWGCGNGRFVVEFADLYDRLEACDNSLLMIWSIYNLAKRKEWEILNKVERNCRKVSDTVEYTSLKMSTEQIEIIRSKIIFFVANAANLSLKNESINHLFSIYFTDVLPLKILLPEIDRLLPPNGLFIHFGPLEYFFTNEEEMLSAEEIRHCFESQGYTVLTDEFKESHHLLMKKSMSNNVYDNWFFIAQKTQPIPKRIGLNSKLLRNPNARLEVVEGKYQIANLFTVFELPQLVYEILTAINGHLSLKEVLNQCSGFPLIKKDTTELLQILKQLYTTNMIRLYEKNG